MGWSAVHLDSTTFSLHGNYEVDSDDENAIQVTHGYSTRNSFSTHGFMSLGLEHGAVFLVGGRAD